MDDRLSSKETPSSSHTLDCESIEDLAIDCYTFLDKLTERANNPKWLQTEALALQKRLSELLDWYDIH